MRKNIMLTMLLFAGLALFPGCTSMTGETIGENIDDSTIHAQAAAVVLKDSDARYLKIDITVTKGEVVLTGFVNSGTTEERIISHIRAIRGVKSVKSLLRTEK